MVVAETSLTMASLPENLAAPDIDSNCGPYCAREWRLWRRVSLLRGG